MAIFGALFAALGRFAGNFLTTTLGWASSLLFGRVPRSKQILLSLETFGSLAWVALLAGVIVPTVGTLLLAAVPAPPFIGQNWIRLAMLAGAIVLPLLMGIGAFVLLEPARRPHGLRNIAIQLLRGYPLALLLAFTLVFLALVGIVRKVRTLAKRWSDAHIPVVIKPGGYESVVRDLDSVLEASGLPMRQRPAPAVLALPAKLIAAVAGPGVQQLVPDRLTELVGPAIEVSVYPSDVAISGSRADVARARAAIASRLSSSAAYLTTTAEAQAIEDRLETLARSRRGNGAAPRVGALSPELAAALTPIDETLATLDVPYDEWEVLYRIRLQFERDLLAGERPGASFPGRPARTSSVEEPASASPWAPVLGLAGLALVALDLCLAVVDRLRPTSRA